MRSRFQWAAGAVCLAATGSVLAMLSLAQAPSATQAGAGQVVPAPAAQQQAARPVPSEAQGERTAPRKTPVGSQGPLPEHAVFSADDVHKGSVLFLQNCAFCHGKDATGGESGPSLTQSKYVAADKDGENISQPIHGSRLEKGMPKFNLTDAEIHSLTAFIHAQQDAYLSQSGNRKGVEPEDLLTGNAAAGKRFFEGTGGCVGCHSETSLKGVATRYAGLRLEERMLYPESVKETATVTKADGSTVSGTVMYHDEFTLALTDAAGKYQTFPMDKVRAEVKNPAQAHIDLLGKYTDDDVHNLYAYIETMK